MSFNLLMDCLEREIRKAIGERPNQTCYDLSVPQQLLYGIKEGKRMTFMTPPGDIFFSKRNEAELVPSLVTYFPSSLPYSKMETIETIHVRKSEDCAVKKTDASKRAGRKGR